MRWDADLADGQRLEVGVQAAVVLHTGPRTRAVCLHADELGCVFSGDTSSRAVLAPPGVRSATGPRSRRRSVRINSLPDENGRPTGHGSDTTIGAERSLLGD